MYVSCGVSLSIYLYIIFTYITRTCIYIYIFCVYMSTYKYKEIHMCQIYIIYILGKMDVEKGRGAYGGWGSGGRDGGRGSWVVPEGRVEWLGVVVCGEWDVCGGWRSVKWSVCEWMVK